MCEVYLEFKRQVIWNVLENMAFQNRLRGFVHFSNI